MKLTATIEKNLMENYRLAREQKPTNLVTDALAEELFGVNTAGLADSCLFFPDIMLIIFWYQNLSYCLNV